jgi:hypothetical protein
MRIIPISQDKIYVKNRVIISLGALSLGLKRPESEANHSPPSSAEVKKLLGFLPPLPNTFSWRGA